MVPGEHKERIHVEEVAMQVLYRYKD